MTHLVAASPLQRPSMAERAARLQPDPLQRLNMAERAAKLRPGPGIRRARGAAPGAVRAAQPPPPGARAAPRSESLAAPGAVRARRRWRQRRRRRPPPHRPGSRPLPGPAARAWLRVRVRPAAGVQTPWAASLSATLLCRPSLQGTTAHRQPPGHSWPSKSNVSCERSAT